MLAWVLAALSLGAVAAGAVDESLRATLVQMGRDDQEAIRIATADPTRPLSDAEIARIGTIAKRNDDLIRSIVAARGWPGQQLAGVDGAHAAWLVVQHMDQDPEFQRGCLQLMEVAVWRRRGHRA